MKATKLLYLEHFGKELAKIPEEGPAITKKTTTTIKSMSPKAFNPIPA
jgi:hypothetical protein